MFIIYYAKVDYKIWNLIHVQYSPNFADFKAALIHSLDIYLLKTSYMTDPKETAINKTDKGFALVRLTLSLEEIHNKEKW